MGEISVVIASVIASVAVTCMVTNIRCKQQLEQLDELFQDATDNMKRICEDIAEWARSAIEEARKR